MLYQPLLPLLTLAACAAAAAAVPQVEYINLRGTSRENPAVCKYTGNKYYSEDWRSAH